MDINENELTLIIDQLNEYTSLTDDEVSESVNMLIFAARFKPPYVSEKFYKALISELKSQLIGYQKNFKIMSEEITETRTIKYLESK